MKKARLATNQANARAAYAAATTQYMLDYADTAPSAAVSYTYETSKGAATKDTTTGTSGLDTGVTTDISTWEIGTKVNGTALGDETAKKWTVILGTDGAVTGYSATY